MGQLKNSILKEVRPRSTVFLIGICLLLVLWIKEMSKFVPQYRDTFIELGLNKARKSQFEQALRYYHKAINHDSKSELGYFYIGQTYLAMEQYDMAILYFRQAALLNLKAYEPHYYLGVAYRSKGDYVEAAAAFEKSFELNPYDYNLFYEKGKTNVIQKDWYNACRVALTLNYVERRDLFKNLVKMIPLNCFEEFPTLIYPYHDY